jgi:hypothetical protein
MLPRTNSLSSLLKDLSDRLLFKFYYIIVLVYSYQRHPAHAEKKQKSGENAAAARDKLVLFSLKSRKIEKMLLPVILC